MLKYLSGIFHAVEWERACSFFCMAFSTDALAGQVCDRTHTIDTVSYELLQIAFDAINFQTKYENDREVLDHLSVCY